MKNLRVFLATLCLIVPLFESAYAVNEDDKPESPGNPIKREKVVAKSAEKNSGQPSQGVKRKIKAGESEKCIVQPKKIKMSKKSEKTVVSKKAVELVTEGITGVDENILSGLDSKPVVRLDGRLEKPAKECFVSYVWGFSDSLLDVSLRYLFKQEKKLIIKSETDVWFGSYDVKCKIERHVYKDHCSFKYCHPDGKISVFMRDSPVTDIDIRMVGMGNVFSVCEKKAREKKGKISVKEAVFIDQQLHIRCNGEIDVDLENNATMPYAVAKEGKYIVTVDKGQAGFKQ